MSDHEQCSRAFFEAFSAGIGSYHVSCACGRTFFASAARGVFSGGELDEILEKKVEHPGRYIDTHDEAVSIVNLGAEYVHGCPCGAEARYENWVWNNRIAIMKYLRARTRSELATAQDNFDLCAQVPELGLP